ncbi:M15 family metallopeptidase [Robiginitalea sp. SC105]|uniref:M15 family metallopeptidase n=1 Tax=Robiginitalea sp. SC105 TaxID=2762332 RepID=UPI00163A2CD6|nr:M15 family metallopeptidase [Robiginitalea sp. SC105]MBC2840289.1 M15 family metallopeptidase [Robiginitalea sp. SC105]
MDKPNAGLPAICSISIFLIVLCACRGGGKDGRQSESGALPPGRTEAVASDLADSTNRTGSPEAGKDGYAAGSSGTGEDPGGSAGDRTGRAGIPKPPSLESLPDTAFIRLADYSDGFSYDLRYATNNNFLEEAVYPCGECYTRVKTARALLDANREFRSLGYRIRFFDCYRPNSVQYKMWELVPNPQYVANPVKGSIHNKGGAVDITLETLDGAPLDMGTDFDYFGPRAHHDHTDLPEAVLEHRRVLKETMESHGFWSIRTEWWHYNLRTATNDPVADFRWPCDRNEKS